MGPACVACSSSSPWPWPTALSGLAEAQTLRIVMHSDLKALDPIWSGTYISRNHGYLIYDTLFSMDEKFQPKPQMVAG